MEATNETYDDLTPGIRSAVDKSATVIYPTLAGDWTIFYLNCFPHSVLEHESEPFTASLSEQSIAQLAEFVKPVRDRPRVNATHTTNE